ncbi:MAG: transposase [Treponema sp.]|nr:transposase [Treponema sp.]
MNTIFPASNAALPSAFNFLYSICRLTAAADGLAWFPGAVSAVSPGTEAQLCMIHTVRNSVKYIPCKDRKAATGGLKETCLAPSAGAASCALERFAEK